jgi:hypothetical protein
MTTYSQSAAHQIVQSALRFTVTPEQAATVARNLGIEVEDPKPEPGIYFTKHGDVLIVNTSRGNNYPDTLWMIGHGGAKEVNQVNVEQSNHTINPLTPARVVPAETVRLTEEQVGELWEGQRSMHLTGWAGLSGSYRASWTATVNAALAKYGHGHTTPSRSDVYEAIKANDPKEKLSYQELSDATDAVMALLEHN